MAKSSKSLISSFKETFGVIFIRRLLSKEFSIFFSKAGLRRNKSLYSVRTQHHQHAPDTHRDLLPRSLSTHPVVDPKKLSGRRHLLLLLLLLLLLPLPPSFLHSRSILVRPFFVFGVAPQNVPPPWRSCCRYRRYWTSEIVVPCVKIGSIAQTEIFQTANSRGVNSKGSKHRESICSVLLCMCFLTPLLLSLSVAFGSAIKWISPPPLFSPRN